MLNKSTKDTGEKGQSLQLVLLGKLDIHMQNNEIGHVMHKNQYEMDSRFKYWAKKSKTPTRK